MDELVLKSRQWTSIIQSYDFLKLKLREKNY